MKLIHRGYLAGPDGAVSPLCAKVPKAIDLRKATWTNRDAATTCPKCLAVIRATPRGERR